MLEVCLLGPSGMMPVPDRWLSVLVARHNGRIIMIDCGEGTQIPLKELGWNFNSIESLLLTHYHADHVAGLPGLLLTLGNMGYRTRPLHIYGPPGLMVVVPALMVIAPIARYDIVLHELPAEEPFVFETAGLQVSSLPMDHGTPCLAYSLYLPRSGRFNPDSALAIGVPREYWSALQNGEEVAFEGRKVTPAQVMGEPRKGIKVTYCTDSRPVENLAGFAEDSDLFVCEGMYGDDRLLDKAVARGHMTMREAAEVASKAAVRTLWLTHFSPSVTDPGLYEKAVRQVFSNTVMGRNLLSATLRYDSESPIEGHSR